MAQTIETEIDRNFDYFQRHVASFLPDHAGQFALLRNQAVIEFFESAAIAERAGITKFDDECFSIQEVTQEPVDLGFFTHAFDQG